MDKKNANAVVIYVCGQRFPLITDDSENYVVKIGNMVDSRIKEIGLGNPRLNGLSCALLAALDYCDEQQKCIAAINEQKSQINDYVNTVVKMQKEIDQLKKEISLKDQQINTLNEQNEKLINDSKELYIQHQKRELVPNKTIISGGHIQKSNNKHNSNQGADNDNTTTVPMNSNSAKTDKVEISDNSGEFTLFND